MITQGSSQRKKAHLQESLLIFLRIKVLLLFWITPKQNTPLWRIFCKSSRSASVDLFFAHIFFLSEFKEPEKLKESVFPPCTVFILPENGMPKRSFPLVDQPLAPLQSPWITEVNQLQTPSLCPKDLGRFSFLQLHRHSENAVRFAFTLSNQPKTFHCAYVTHALRHVKSKQNYKVEILLLLQL